MRFPALVAIAALVAACAAGGGATPPVQASAALVLSAGMVPLEPSSEGLVPSAPALDRLGIQGVAEVFDLTTPPGEPFSINALTRAEANEGDVKLCVAHVTDGGATPSGGPETLGFAGILPDAEAPAANGPWLEVSGDGYCRMTLQGAIEAEQVLAICAESDDGKTVVLVRLSLGDESVINGTGPATPVQDDYPGVLETATLYSSDSFLFGQPTVAAVGDTTTVVVFDGDRSDPERFERREVRLQHDRATGAVTNGGSTPVVESFPGWRDHEIAARGDVLAVVRSGGGEVLVRVSFDGGRTFGQAASFPSGSDEFSPRLVQTAIGADFRLAVLFWRFHGDFSSDLVLVEGAPSPAGDPTAYAFGAEQLLFHDDESVLPLILGAAYSDGGDLVVGYAFTRFGSGEDPGSATVTTETHCATRLLGGAFEDVLVESEDVTGFDPSVSLVGQGASMRIFLAYEAGDGVRMRTSADGGRSFSEATVGGGAGANMPTVVAREQEGKLRVDLLFLVPADAGLELHLRHWDDFGNAPSGDFRIVKATTTAIPPEPGGEPGQDPNAPPDRDDPSNEFPGGVFFGGFEEFSMTQVAWFGYDATLAGDDVVVVFDEETTDFGGFGFEPPVGGDPIPFSEDNLEPVPSPDPMHAHQLKLVRLD